jgi:hypothetical protein
MAKWVTDQTQLHFPFPPSLYALLPIPCAPTSPSSSHHPTPNYLCIPWHIGLALKLLNPSRLDSLNKSRFVNARLGLSLKCGLPKVQGLDTQGPLLLVPQLQKVTFETTLSHPKVSQKTTLSCPWDNPRLSPKEWGLHQVSPHDNIKLPKRVLRGDPKCCLKTSPTCPKFWSQNLTTWSMIWTRELNPQSAMVETSHATMVVFGMSFALCKLNSHERACQLTPTLFTKVNIAFDALTFCPLRYAPICHTPITSHLLGLTTF